MNCREKETHHTKEPYLFHKKTPNLISFTKNLSHQEIKRKGE